MFVSFRQWVTIRVFFLKHHQVLVSSLSPSPAPYSWGFGLPVGPSVTHITSAYTGSLFLLHKNPCKALCGFSGAAVAKYTNQ